jgi:hypothetical protein
MLNGQVPARSGVASVPFATALGEDTVTVTGQHNLLTTSRVTASVLIDNDDVYLQDWQAPEIRNVIPGTGFDILLRTRTGAFTGPVKVNWQWS